MATHVSPNSRARVSTPVSAFDRWVEVIGVLKLLEAALFIALGIGVFKLLHKDLVDVVTRIAVDLRFDPEGRFVSLLLDKVALISPHRLKEIGAAIFAHAGLDILEGTGLILRKLWAEFITLGFSAFFVPIEIYELTLRVTWVRLAIIAINVAVVIYLAFHVQMRIRVHETRMRIRIQELRRRKRH